MSRRKFADAEDRVLHPTKGWRKLSVKRSRAQMLVSLAAKGGIMSLATNARFLKDGYLGQFGSI